MFNIRIEPIREAQAELDPLLRDHYKLTESTYLDHPCAVDFDRWAQMEQAGEFFVVVARVRGEVVGYFIVFVCPSTHFEGLVGVEDAQYVDAAYRGLGIATNMLRVVEFELVRRSCLYLFVSSKHEVGGPDLEQYFRRSGYRPIASVFCKPLGGVQALADETPSLRSGAAEEMARGK